MSDSPNVREMFEGSDRHWGDKLCKRLVSEGLGTAVIYQSEDKRINLTSNRNQGTEEISFNEKVERGEMLLGVLVESDPERGEFVYVSAGDEEGLVFHERDVGRRKKYNSLDRRYVCIAVNTSFSQIIFNRRVDDGGTTEIILSEDSDP